MPRLTVTRSHKIRSGACSVPVGWSGPAAAMVTSPDPAAGVAVTVVPVPLASSMIARVAVPAGTAGGWARVSVPGSAVRVPAGVSSRTPTSDQPARTVVWSGA